MFWTPAFAGVTIQETFYETIKEGMLENFYHFLLFISHSEFRIPNLRLWVSSL
jgi:hypothetical protein